MQCKLYNHQQKLVNEDPKKCLIAWGTGGGKTLTALSLAKGPTLVICPKTTSLDDTWTKDGKDVTIISKETFRRDWKKLGWFETVIMDESHTLSGVSPSIKWVNRKPIPKTSQLFEACMKYLEKNPPIRLYLLTATPIRSAMGVYGLGMLLGKNFNFYQFRQLYYTPILMNMREIWVPKKDKETQEMLGKVVQGLGYTGKLDDWVDVPEQIHKVINVPLTKEQIKKLKEIPIEYPDPLVLVGKKHQIEQGILIGNEFSPSQKFPTNKLEAIEDLLEEFGKVVVFAKYTQQISQIADYFRDKTEVFTLQGQTINRKEVITKADTNPKCILIVQSSISAGYELPTFRCIVYASLGYSYVDYAQSLGRTLRINNIQKNLYVYLLSGEIDKAVYNALQNKNDFNEKIYYQVRIIS